MDIQSLLLEVDITDRILKDPGKAKMLGIAWRHDKNLPYSMLSKLGPKPTDAEVAKAWSGMLEKTLERTDYGDLSRDFKFADWLTKLYTSGQADWEDISGEGGDALGKWNALSVRGLLEPRHQDLNRYRTLRDLQVAMASGTYQAELNRIKNAEQIARMKKDARDIVLIDTPRVWAAIPLNYGACYVFNNAEGYQANFCTGSSSGANWYKNYAPRGPLVMVVDKDKSGTANGKWQMHAPTDQLVNADQDRRYDRGWNDEQFADQFPGLMRKIGQSMLAKKDEIVAASQETFGQPYKVEDAVSELKAKFPKSWASKAKGDDTEAEPEPDLLPSSHYTVDEQYRQFLAPDFINKLRSDNTAWRDIIVRRTDGESKTVNAYSADNALYQLMATDPDFFQPGSIRGIAKVS